MAAVGGQPSRSRSRSPEPAAPSGGTEPERLWLIAPQKPGGVQGEYTRQRGRDKHGQAIWRQVSGAWWLFSNGPEGCWCFANKEALIQERLGYIQSVAPHGGRSPQELAHWRYHDGGSWREDPSIQVTASRGDFEGALADQEAEAASRQSPAEPEGLWLVAPPYVGLQGQYTKRPGRAENGRAVWQQLGGSGWLFSTLKGRWFVTDGEAGIAMNGGVLASAVPHRDRPPQESEQWQYFYEGRWHASASIRVSALQEEGERWLAQQEVEAWKRAAAAPRSLWLVAPPAPGLQGEYAQQPGRVERGQAVWRHVGGQGWLYSNGLGGLWCFARQEGDIARNLGVLQCTTPHEGRAPQELEGWHVAEGSTWRRDSSIRVTTSPNEARQALAEQAREAAKRVTAASERIWLVAAPYAGLQGEYARQPGRVERGQPVWQQVGGSGWLYSTNGGRWFIADREDAIMLCGGVLASAAPHHGRAPQETTQWQKYHEGRWHVDASIRMTAAPAEFDQALQEQGAEACRRAARAPEHLWLVAPLKPGLQGRYEKQRGRVERGQAVWRHAGGDGWLYCNGPGGFWCFAGKESDIAEKLGLLQSATPHDGRSPEEVTEWQCAEGSHWRTDPSIRVAAVQPSPAAAVAAAEPAAAPVPAPAGPGRVPDAAVALLEKPRIEEIPEPVEKPPEIPSNPPQADVATPRVSRREIRASHVPAPREQRQEEFQERQVQYAATESSAEVAPRTTEEFSVHSGDDQVSCPVDCGIGVRAAVRAEVDKLLAQTGLAEKGAVPEVDVNALVEQCSQTLVLGGATGQDQEAIHREVLRMLLIGRPRVGNCDGNGRHSSPRIEDVEIPRYFSWECCHAATGTGVDGGLAPACAHARSQPMIWSPQQGPPLGCPDPCVLS